MTRSRFWTAPEITTLKQHYPRGGLYACEAVLPGRTRGSIYQHAAALGLRAPGQLNLRVNWQKTPFVDAQIRELHCKDLERGDVTAFAERIKYPSWWVSRRARELGLVTPRFRELPWREAEVEVLHKTAHMTTKNARLHFSKAGFERSETAIQVKRHRLGTNPNDNGYYNAHQLSLLLGCDQKTVMRWFERDGLKAKKQGDFWMIHESDLRAFIVTQPFRVVLRKIPGAHAPWFVDLLAGRSALRVAA